MLQPRVDLLEQVTDAAGRVLDVHVLTAPMRGRQRFDHAEFAAGYVGYYVCNGAVIAAEA